MNRAHSLALGRKGNFCDALKACFESFGFQPGFAGSHYQRSFGGIALQRPTPLALLQHGIVSAIGGGKNAVKLESQRATNFSTSIAVNRAFRSVSRAPQIY